jgi:predicted molibdopterin-dependent oxidoreductase YjgC
MKFKFTDGWHNVKITEAVVDNQHDYRVTLTVHDLTNCENKLNFTFDSLRNKMLFYHLLKSLEIPFTLNLTEQTFIGKTLRIKTRNDVIKNVQQHDK